MASPFTIELVGLEATLKRMKDAGVDIMVEVDAELASGAIDIERDAVQRVPVDKGFLRNAIGYKKVQELSYEVVAQTRYAPYVEFGTVTKVQIPSGAETYAAQFKGKGIIKTGGMRARPFMFPALFKNAPRIMEEIKRLLKKKR
jgi:HK97 gp10 family phage protein